MPQITPTSAEDCKQFIKQHREEIIAGEYDIIADQSWIDILETDELLFLFKYCAGSKLALASSRKVPPDVLSVLARDPDFGVRLFVARNENTPIFLLEKLAKDPNMDVRVSVAGNIKTPVRLFEVLARQEDHVQWAIVHNPNASPEALKIIVLNPGIKIAVARERQGQGMETPEEVFRILLSDRDRNVRKILAKLSNTPVHILEVLAKDTDPVVKEAAKKNPRYKQNSCFIAAACYGDIEAIEVKTLRAFRDKVLLPNVAGRVSCAFYYRLSSPIADWLSTHKRFAHLARKHFLDRLVRRADAFLKRHEGS
jgi:hypothetical protein